MELDSVDRIREAFYRLVGSNPDDQALTDLGEAENEVCDLALTIGFRAAQLWLLDMGYGGWRKRSTALSFSGSDDADGGRYVALPTDFLRAVGRDRESPLKEASGKRWGGLIEETQDDRRGNYFYFRGEQLWLARAAQPPTTLYLDYHYKHPVFGDAVVLDFPVDHRWLGVAESALAASRENWFPLGDDGKRNVGEAVTSARERSRKLARQTKQPRRLRPPARFGSHW